VAAQKPLAAALNTHVVQNTDRLEGQNQHLDRPVAPRVKGDVEVLRQHTKQALDIFSHRLLQAVEDLVLLSAGHWMRGHEERIAGIKAIDQVVGSERVVPFSV